MILCICLSCECNCVFRDCSVGLSVNSMLGCDDNSEDTVAGVVLRAMQVMALMLNQLMTSIKVIKSWQEDSCFPSVCQVIHFPSSSTTI